jgi:hypothetical protein
LVGNTITNGVAVGVRVGPGVVVTNACGVCCVSMPGVFCGVGAKLSGVSVGKTPLGVTVAGRGAAVTVLAAPVG